MSEAKEKARTLSDEELDMVTGGSTEETNILMDMTGMKTPEELVKWMGKNLDISVLLETERINGFWAGKNCKYDIAMENCHGYMDKVVDAVNDFLTEHPEAYGKI